MNLHSYRQQILAIAAPWSPQKRYLCTLLMITLIGISWWGLSFKKLHRALAKAHQERSHFHEVQNEYEMLLNRVNNKDTNTSPIVYDSSTLFTKLLEIVNQGGLVLEKSAAHNEVHHERIELGLHGSFEQVQKFLHAISNNQMSISRCECKRIDDRSIHCSIVIDVREN